MTEAAVTEAFPLPVVWRFEIPWSCWVDHAPLVHAGEVVARCGPAIMTLAQRAKRRAYIVGVDRNDGSFTCEIVGPGPEAVQFAPTRPSANIPQVDSVLGETTLDGILRVIEIPRALLG